MKKFAMISLSVLTIVSAATAGSMTISSSSQGEIYQSLTGLKNGVYRVNMKGFYRAGDQWDAAYYYHEEGETSNLNAYE